MADPPLTPLGELLERARGATSKRQAAREAGISEGRWRQIVTGQQKAGGGIVVPANPRRETVIAMARAVGADIAEALGAAGFSAHDVEQAILDGPPADDDARLFEQRVRADEHLVREAREHLLNQYALLRRIAPVSVEADTKPPLRAVAEHGDPADRAALSNLAREARENYERQKGAGTNGDDHR